MYEVIIERPRAGAGWARKQPAPAWRLLATDDDSRDDGGPTRQPLRPRGRHSKGLNENLAPLRRFLRSRVGRPWDEVHAEICRHIAPRSTVQKHVLDHLYQYVERHPVFVDGWPHRAMGAGPQRDRYFPLVGSAAFYVCPETGRLRVAGRPPRPDGQLVRPLDDWRQLRRIGGQWFLIRLAPLPDWDRRTGCRDVLLRRSVEGSHMQGPGGALERTYGRRDVYAVAKEQPSAQRLPALLRQAERRAQEIG